MREYNGRSIEEKFILADKGKAIKIKNIAYLEANRAYCKIHLVNNECFYVSKPLCNIEQVLPDNFFFRCHKSFLVNTNEINSCNFSKGEIILKNKEVVKLSKAKTAHFKQDFLVSN